MYLNGHESLRLKFRPLQIDDIDIWQNFFIDNPSLPYLGFDINHDILSLSQGWIESQLKRYSENRYGHLALIDKASQEFIGQCGLLTQTVDNENLIEIGYHILPQYWGNGYATEAATTLKNFSFENQLTDKLVSIIDVRNRASQNVARKNGMRPLYEIKYQGLDVIVFGIKLAEWRK